MVLAARAADLPPPPSAEPVPFPAEAGADESEAGAIVLRHADEAEFFHDSGWIHASGNVLLQYGEQTLSADAVRVNTRDRKAYAEGNVVVTRGGTETWRGDRLEYDFEQEAWTLAGVTGEAEPFRLLRSERIERDKANRFVVYNCRITTCEFDEPHTHYHVRARKLVILPGERLKIYGARWYFGRVPALYWPYWTRNLKERFGFSLRPGYRSREGYFALGSYSYPLGTHGAGETHLDYRTRRGWAMGQDFAWRNRAAGWSGDVRLYYADDQAAPDDDHDIPSDRSRARFRHQYAPTPQDTLRLQAHWLSDRDMLEDFFVREHRRSRQPENFAVYTRRGQRYVADLLLRGRVNEFYDETQRVPELTVRWFRSEIADSGVFYEGLAAAARLERLWSNANTNDAAYAVTRFDTGHMLYRPRKLAGFLNVVPRAGYRYTWFSNTRGMRFDWVPNEDGSLDRVPVEVERGADARSQFQVGSEASFKAFKAWTGGIVSPLRHVVEPYADYAFAPEPTVSADNLYQFDAVDRLAKNHSVKIGLRQKWQTKVGDASRDFLDLDLHTRLRMEPESDQDPLTPFAFDLRFRPIAGGWTLNMDGAYNTYDSALERFNVETALDVSEFWKATAEYRVRREQSALLHGNLLLKPSRAWNFGIGARYEFEEQRLEETEGLVARFWDCMALRARLGFVPGYERDDGRWRDDEWRFALEFWLTAFPEVRLLSR